jgi:hypothetical protein
MAANVCRLYVAMGCPLSSRYCLGMAACKVAAAAAAASDERDGSSWDHHHHHQQQQQQ